MTLTKRSKIATLIESETELDEVLIRGWIRTRRNAKDFSFLEINDGSCIANIQVIAESGLPGYDTVAKLNTGSSLEVTGQLRASPGKGQKWEIFAKKIKIYQACPETYPLQKKRHTDEFLRTIAHLRPRTNKYGAAFRMRSEMALAIHRFFHERGFVYLHTPILTGSDCEGAGALFNVTTLKPENFQKISEASASLNDFFGKSAFLTVSGQLEAELFAMALGDVYTFGPTFRAENSNTSRHAAEFWMVEPEMAFCDLKDNMENAEALIKYLVKYCLTNCNLDLELFFRFVDKTLFKTLETIVSEPFAKISYKEAIDILKSAENSFENTVGFGKDLQTEHERFLAEKYFCRPVFVYDYPCNIKPFYMRLNDDGATVAAMDLLVPRIGELIGGSQREERLDVLETRLEKSGLRKKDYWWYIDSRRFGSVFHSGYGMGFERLIMLVTGISNIRDVLPFARTPGSIEF